MDDFFSWSLSHGKGHSNSNIHSFGALSLNGKSWQRACFMSLFTVRLFPVCLGATPNVHIVFYETLFSWVELVRGCIRFCRFIVMLYFPSALETSFFAMTAEFLEAKCCSCLLYLKRAIKFKFQTEIRESWSFGWRSKTSPEEAFMPPNSAAAVLASQPRPFIVILSRKQRPFTVECIEFRVLYSWLSLLINGLCLHEIAEMVWGLTFLP